MSRLGWGQDLQFSFDQLAMIPIAVRELLEGFPGHEVGDAAIRSKNTCGEARLQSGFRFVKFIYVSPWEAPKNTASGRLNQLHYEPHIRQEVRFRR